MPVSFVATGAVAANNTDASFNMSAPTCLDNDILIACVYEKSRQVITPPAGWTAVIEFDDGSNNNRINVFWKRAVAASDSGAAFTFTKPIDDNLLMAGSISAWRGCKLSGSPINAGTPAGRRNAAADNITFPAFSPSGHTHVVAVGGYNANQTTPGTVSGTDPLFFSRVDQEQSVANNHSLFVQSGESSGAAISSGRTLATNSVTDAANVGAFFGLDEEPAGIATETDTGLAATAVPGARTVTVGIAAETNSGLAATAVPGAIAVVAGLPSEADSALAATAIGGAATVVAGLPAEADSALHATPTGINLVEVGLASEGDSVEAATPTIGRVGVETDTAPMLGPIEYRGAGPYNANVFSTDLVLQAPANIGEGDLLIAIVHLKASQTVSAPIASQVVPAPTGWTELVTHSVLGVPPAIAGNGTRMTLFWRRSGPSDNNAMWTFSKPIDDDATFGGVIWQWYGVRRNGSPFDDTPPVVTNNAIADSIPYADYDPVATRSHVVAAAVYNQQGTVPGLMSGNTPELVNRYHKSQSFGENHSLFLYSGPDFTGDATGARSHSTTSPVNARSLSAVFALIPQPIPNVATEVDSALAASGYISFAQTVTVGIAGEQGFALSASGIGGATALDVGLAGELDTARAADAAIGTATVTVGLAGEHDDALSVTAIVPPSQIVEVGIATELDDALSATGIVPEPEPVDNLPAFIVATTVFVVDGQLVEGVVAQSIAPTAFRVNGVIPPTRFRV